MSIITLYHGTIHELDSIDVGKGKSYKDFGIGFYLTENPDRAADIAKRNLRIESERAAKIGGDAPTFAYVYAYEFDTDCPGLNHKHFAEADKDWLRFIILNRRSDKREHDYDIVTGPTANDNTRTSIRTVINAANGGINDTALDLLLVLLEPNSLPTQYYFGSNKAAGLLMLKDRRVVL